MAKDKARFSFLQRLRYWGVSLAKEYGDVLKTDASKIMASRAEFDKWFEDFWKAFLQTTLAAHQRAEEDKISNFALVRNETRWKQAKEHLSTLVMAGAL